MYVDALRGMLPDAGSTPAASTIKKIRAKPGFFIYLKRLLSISRIPSR